jgi:hypothetical protein
VATTRYNDKKEGFNPEGEKNMENAKKKVCEKIRDIAEITDAEEYQDFLNWLDGAVSAMEIMQRRKSEMKSKEQEAS